MRVMVDLVALVVQVLLLLVAVRVEDGWRAMAVAAHMALILQVVDGYYPPSL